MREKKFGKLFLTWLLAATMVLTLLPVGMLAADAPDEATEDGEAVLTPVAGAEAGETAVPAEAASMLLATPAAADTPIAVPEGKLIFDKANGVITGIDADWLANNKDKPLSVTIPAEINGTPVTSIGQNAFKAKNAGLKNHPQVVAVDFSNAANLSRACFLFPFRRSVSEKPDSDMSAARMFAAYSANSASASPFRTVRSCSSEIPSIRH